MTSAVMGLPQGNVEQSNEKVTVVPNPEEGSKPQTANNDAVIRESATATGKASNDCTVTKRGEHKSYVKAVNGEANGTNSANGTQLVNGINGTHDDSPYPTLPENGSDGRHETQAWRAGGVRFAPLRIPLKRRLQTAAVLFHSMSIVVLVAMFWFTCANPLSWPILIPYLLHLLFSNAAADGKLSYRSEYLRSLPLWRLFAGYFPAKLHKTHDLDPTRRYIMGYHPHGIISHGAWCAFATNALNFNNKFPGITNSLLTLDSNFRIPFYRDWILGMGIRSVSKESIRNTLGKGGPKNDGQGRAVTIVIGGARESLEAHPGTLRLILKSRKGFVKMALRTGADLVPVIGFGENDLYDQLSPKTHPGVHKFQMFILRVFKFTLPGFHGRGLLNYDVGLMPYRRSVNIVVGRPIRIDTEPGHEPTQEEIDLYHGRYVDELEKLWNSYKDQFSPGRVAEMEIFA